MSDSQHNPNAGENECHYCGGSNGKGGLSAGVGDGLSSAASFETKNAEKVSRAQRPQARRESCGKGMVIGT